MSALREDITKLEQELSIKKNQLQHAERNCAHNWSEVTPDHIYHKGYTIPGDPPGTMGIDWRGPAYVPAKTEERWKRTCKFCGKVEYTNKTTQTVINTPKF